MPKSKTMNAVARSIVGEVDAARARVLVELPWMGPGALSIWAPVATLMSGGGRGTYFMPEPGDEVLVAFDQGRLDFMSSDVFGTTRISRRQTTSICASSGPSTDMRLRSSILQPGPATRATFASRMRMATAWPTAGSQFPASVRSRSGRLT